IRCAFAILVIHRSDLIAMRGLRLLIVGFGALFALEALGAVIDRLGRDLVVAGVDHHPADLGHVLAAGVTPHEGTSRSAAPRPGPPAASSRRRSRSRRRAGGPAAGVL